MEKSGLDIELGVMVVLVVTSLFGLVGIGLAIVLHEGSTIVVVPNALRLIEFQGRGLRPT